MLHSLEQDRQGAGSGLDPVYERFQVERRWVNGLPFDRDESVANSEIHEFAGAVEGPLVVHFHDAKGVVQYNAERVLMKYHLFVSGRMRVRVRGRG